MKIAYIIFTAASLVLAAGSAQAAITVLGTASAVTAADSGPGGFTLTAEGAGNRDGIYSRAFNAGATSDMLVVSLSHETSDDYLGWGVTYNGVNLSLATQSSAGSGTSIFYLANPSATGSIAIDFTGKGTVNGIGLGIASLDNTDPGGEIFFNNGVSSSGTESIGITVGNADSFVMFAGDANNAVNSPTLNSPLTTIFAGPQDIGSNQAAAGYQNGVTVGSKTYSWNVPVASKERGISVAAFSAVPEPGTALLGALGLLCLLRRCR